MMRSRVLLQRVLLVGYTSGCAVDSFRCLCKLDTTPAQGTLVPSGSRDGGAARWLSHCNGRTRALQRLSAAPACARAVPADGVETTASAGG